MKSQLGDPRVKISGATSPSLLGDQKRSFSIARPIGPRVAMSSASVGAAVLD